MQVDVLLDPFDGRWSDIRAAAEAADASPIGGLWTYDHLAGSVHRAGHVVEAWTTLSALAGATRRLVLGPLVLNAANRDPATLAVAAATFQEVSGGRLLLGIGAGGGRSTPYAAEQRGLGREVPGDRARRAAVEATVQRWREVWSGSVGGVAGYLRPDPPPPVIVGGFGPKMAELAGRVGDGINVPGGPGFERLVDVARRARAAAGREAEPFVVTVSARPAARELARLADAGVDRAIVNVRPPYVDDIRRVADLVTS
ncbi:MAG TPA: LLM class flavin-dependent oxidoreductase [Acidimicrobiales bacterium]|nr:LLM class flavin-dependent oxidoreductase [Acidimicrobiales bacterium]